MPRKNNNIYQTAEKTRSKLEDRVLANLQSRNVTYEYEACKIPYIISSTYSPDLVLPNNVIIEIKGYFFPEDRRKHLLLQKQHPSLDIRFLFDNSRKPIRKGSKTTYGDWCMKHSFMYADKEIPWAWIEEPMNEANRKLLERLVNGK